MGEEIKLKFQMIYLTLSHFYPCVVDSDRSGDRKSEYILFESSDSLSLSFVHFDDR